MKDEDKKLVMGMSNGDHRPRPRPGPHMRQAERDIRTLRALDMRQCGKKWWVIADELQCHEGTVRIMVRDALRRNVADESIEDMKALELARLDALYESLEPYLAHGNRWQLKAIDSALRIMERRAKLFGLDVYRGPETQVNFMIASPEWQRLRGIIETALEPYPDALGALCGALAAMQGVAMPALPAPSIEVVEEEANSEAAPIQH